MTFQKRGYTDQLSIAALGYQTMGFVGAAFATLPFGLAIWWSRKRARLSPA